MSIERVASIDIGTNTILLLIADVEEGRVTPLFENETIARLGEGLQKNGSLLPEAMDRALHALAQCMNHCRDWGAQKTYAVGTSALREAKNSFEFLERVKRELDLSIEIISGEEEAEFSFLAVAKDLCDPERAMLVVDVGGGSTEFIFGKGGRIDHRVSLPLGSVRLTEQFLVSDPLRKEEYGEMEEVVKRWLLKIPHTIQPERLVAVGGTATTLASVEQGLSEFIVEKIHHFVIRKESLRRQVRLYQSKTLEERRKIPGLPPSRADVILAGATILLMAMDDLGMDSALISSQGIRYGLIYKKLNL